MKKIPYIPALLMLFAHLLTASCNSKDDHLAVSAIAIREAQYVSADNVMRITIKDNDSLQLTPFIMPSEAAGVSLTYKNKRPELLSVSQSGLLTAKMVGVDTLAVSTADGGITVSYQVNIISHLIKATGLSKVEDKIIKTGSSFDVNALVTFIPGDTWDKTLICSSDNEAVVTVGEEGVVTGVKEGEATITLKSYYTADGRPISTSFKVKVMDVLVYDLNRAGWEVSTSHSLPKDDAIKNAPGSLIDGNKATCLSMVKPGKTYDGITVTETEDVFFVLDMKSERRFDHFRIDHRTNNKNVYLRVWKISLYGSHDGASYQTIAEDVAVPDVKEADILTSGNVRISGSVSEYRYLKVRYAEWDTKSGSTMQIAEFTVGVEGEEP